MNLVGRSLRIVTVGVVIGGLALAGCSSSSKSSSSSATTTTVTGATAICQSVNDFKASLTSLGNPSTFTGGKEAAQSALDTVKTNLDKVKSTLQSSDKPKVDALQSSITDLQTAINNMSGISGISAVASAASKVGTSAQAVFAVVKAGCPSS